MKKNLIYKAITSVLLVLLTVTSCKEDFLDRFPTGSVSESSVFLTTDNARNALNGVHRLMFWRLNPPSRQDGFGHGSMMIFMDVLGEDLVKSTTANGWYNAAYRWLDHRTENFNLPDFAFRFYYRLITNVNLIINNIDGASGSVADKNELKAQALTYRAFAYHMLVQLFGQRYVAGANNTQLGVPLILDTQLDGQPRATVEEVYTQINKDLDDAILAFGSASPRGAKSNLNINVARGIKARVALTQGLWQVASDNAIAARAGYPLMSKTAYTDGFNNLDNVEWIWGTRTIQDEQGFFATFMAYMSHNFSSTYTRTGPHAILNVLYDAFPASDVRLENFALTGLSAAEKPTAGSLSIPYQSRKFTAASPGLSLGDVPYMRSAEMYLIEAEAKARLGQNGPAAQALFDLNIARDDNYVLSTSTGQALLDEILLYRRLELWGEGFRFLDLKRLNQPLDRLEGVGNHPPAVAQIFTVPAGDMKWEFLIPLSELNANPSMVQNPQ